MIWNEMKWKWKIKNLQLPSQRFLQLCFRSSILILSKRSNRDKKSQKDGLHALILILIFIRIRMRMLKLKRCCEKAKKLTMMADRETANKICPYKKKPNNFFCYFFFFFFFFIFFFFFFLNFEKKRNTIKRFKEKHNTKIIF